MKRLLLILGAALALLVAVMLIRAVRIGSPDSAVDPPPHIEVPAGAAERLAGSLRIPTISHEDTTAFDGAAFLALHEYLRAAFPRVHTELRRETVSSYSLLYTWPGSDTSQKSILLAGHLDVVPVEPGTEATWQEEPFGGRVVDGFIWGRGAIDNKAAILGTLEAAEMLLAQGFHPKRTIHLAFGHDEEVGGTRGAREIAAILANRGVELEMVLDEGGVIGDGVLQGIASPVALVGIAEKGFASVELIASSTGGHSSLPPRQSAIGILSTAITRLEASPMPARLEGPTRQLFDRVAPEFPFVQRAIFANLWLTRPLVMRRLEANPTTNAMLRTTMAPTIFQAGTKDNVLPSHARAVVNFRVLSGDSISAVLAHVGRVIDDPRVEVRLGGRFSSEASAVSSTESESFRTLERVIERMVPDAFVAPYLVVVITDARYYADLCENIFRFLPLRVTARDLERIHGTDERVAIREYENSIRIYRELLAGAASN